MEHIYEDFRELIRRCLEDAVEAGCIDMAQIDAFDKLIDMDKDLQEILMNERIGDYYEDEYSNTTHGGNSYRVGGGRYARRDDRGRYSRRGNSYRGYSRDGEHEHMIEKMERMMEDATSETEREAIRKVLDTI